MYNDFSEAEGERYNRHLILEGFGKEAQLKLKKSRVLVVGAGGLGCPVLQYLSAAGVGVIGIADGDTVSLSNLQRQVLYETNDIGKLKAVISKQRLAALNQELQLRSYAERIEPENALQILGGYDIIVDCTDNFSSRYLLNDACVILQKPLVYGAIFKFEGQVSVFNLHDGPTYRCLFPQLSSEEASCTETGVLGVLPGVVGTWQAAEAIKLITGIGQPLSGQLLTFDLLKNRFNTFRFNTVPINKTIKTLNGYYGTCATSLKEIDAVTLNQWLKGKEVQLIDVRESNEFEQYNIGGKNIPLSVLRKRVNEINDSKITVVLCQSGSRSAKAIDFIQSFNSSITLFNLKGGLNNYNR
jgi:adenylyltransferase/sulfurtransferase